MARKTVAAMLLLVFLAALAGPAQLERARGEEEEIVPQGFGTCDYGVASISYPEGWVAPCELDGHVAMSPDGVAQVLITPFWAGEQEDVSLRELYDTSLVEWRQMVEAFEEAIAKPAQPVVGGVYQHRVEDAFSPGTRDKLPTRAEGA